MVELADDSGRGTVGLTEGSVAWRGMLWCSMAYREQRGAVVDAAHAVEGVGDRRRRAQRRVHRLELLEERRRLGAAEESYHRAKYDGGGGWKWYDGG